LGDAEDTRGDRDWGRPGPIPGSAMQS